MKKVSIKKVRKKEMKQKKRNKTYLVTYYVLRLYMPKMFIEKYGEIYQVEIDFDTGRITILPAKVEVEERREEENKSS